MDAVDRRAYFQYHLIYLRSGQRGLDFLQDNHGFRFLTTDREGNAAVRAELRMRFLGCEFDILRVDIPSAYDDEISHPAGHEQFAVMNESKVPGFEK